MSENAKPERAERNEVHALLRRLRPMDTVHPLIRCGAFRDGGYLLPDCLAGVSACFSPGVSHKATFEEDLAKRGIPSFLADASVESPPPGDVEFQFRKSFLGPKRGDNVITLDDWVAEDAPDQYSDLLLQMDIEGAEYDVITSTSDATLNRFRIILIELHRVQRWCLAEDYERAAATFDKLKNFTVVHLHPNNCCGSSRLYGVSVPRILEITLLRNDYAGHAIPAKIFPHPLDRRNLSNKDELVLHEDLYHPKSRLFSVA